jgi:hypothetical protein
MICGGGHLLTFFFHIYAVKIYFSHKTPGLASPFFSQDTYWPYTFNFYYACKACAITA